MKDRDQQLGYHQLPGAPNAGPFHGASIPRAEGTGLPLFTDTEPIIGWRCWAVVWDAADEHPVRLASIAKPTFWTPGARTEAECWAQTELVVAIDDDGNDAAPVLRPRPQHRAPALDDRCGCGLWAFKTIEVPLGLALAYRGRHAVKDELVAMAVGRVKMWGRVVECENGWRGEFGYPTGELIVYPLVGAGTRARSGFQPVAQLAADVLARSYQVPVQVRPEIPWMPADDPFGKPLSLQLRDTRSTRNWFLAAAVLMFFVTHWLHTHVILSWITFLVELLCALVAGVAAASVRKLKRQLKRLMP